jgi:hypothetical protein
VILDFELPQPSPGESPALIVLEPGRLVFYSYSLPQAQWQVTDAVVIPPLRQRLRAPRGYIHLSEGLEKAEAMLSGIDCTGDFRSPAAIRCDFVNRVSSPWTTEEVWTSKNLEQAGDSADVSLACDGRPVVLATGGGDWTHADFLQAYELPAPPGQGAVASGNPVEFGGPVTSVWPAGKAGVARVVVRDLQTGSYEAYIVKATCSF